MAAEFVMPKLGLTMEEGTISEWLVADGADVAAGAPVLRIETDKTETDIEAPSAGVLHQGAQVGETFACGETVGWFLAVGETAPARVSASAPGAAAQPVAAIAPTSDHATTADDGGLAGRMFVSPNARRVAAERGVPLAAVAGTGPNGRIVSEDVEAWVPSAPPPAAAAAAIPAPNAAGSSATLATFAGRQLADLLGVDAATVTPDASGRVTREAVAQHVRLLLAKQGPANAAAQATLPPALQEPTIVTPLKGMRGTIARRMHQSLTEMAQLSLFMDADLDAVVADRAERSAAGTAPSYTDYIIAAVARALRDHPHVNAQITDDGIAQLPTAHVGMAVALDEGLIVPVVKDTAAHSLDTLAAETSRLAAACRDGSIGMADLENGTFSVSTLGMFGVDGFTPIINPPNAAILGVGRLRDDVVLNDDATVATRSRMTLSLTWDHRAFDGAPAAAFVQSIVALLNDPAALDG